jgi:GNAT superfamily N-acetyltransferase
LIGATRLSESEGDRMVIQVRAATMADLEGIRWIHRFCDDPWHDAAECKAWVGRRLERGFYIQVALVEGQIVGHGEWIVSDEPDKRMLYLGMLQVDDDYQRSGVGRAMIDDGVAYAKSHHCTEIVTIPESDQHTDLFYEKCGFVRKRVIKKCVIPTRPGHAGGYALLPEIPFSVVSDLPFVFGLAQVSSRHMWEVCNRKPATDDRFTPAMVINGRTYVQLFFRSGNDSALVLCWSRLQLTKSLIETILSFGFDCGLKSLSFCFFEGNEPLFAGSQIEMADIEMTRMVVPSN